MIRHADEKPAPQPVKKPDNGQKPKPGTFKDWAQI